MSSFDDIRHAARLLREGRVVAFPTETVYGLGADALNPAAVARVFELKGRPSHNPLIVHVSGPEMARRVVRDGAWTDRADMLARALWPGPLSILVARAPTLPAAVTAGSDLVAVRCPNHPVAIALLFEFGGPLVGPSANLSGQVSPTTAQHVRDSLGTADLFVLEGGACHAGIESTVVDTTSDPIRILRPGLIGADQITAVLGARVAIAAERAGTHAPLSSPGMLDRHYAPAAPARLFSSEEWPATIEQLDGKRAALITHVERDVPAPHERIVMPREAEHYAAALYAALREADSRKPDIILIERPPTGGPIWTAIADRLTRATTP